MSDESISSETKEKMQRELVAVIEGLPRELSQVFVMAYVQKQRRAAIAAALGITLSETESRLATALMMCRTCLAARVDFAVLERLYPCDPLELIHSKALPSPSLTDNLRKAAMKVVRYFFVSLCMGCAIYPPLAWRR